MQTFLHPDTIQETSQATVVQALNNPGAVQDQPGRTDRELDDPTIPILCQTDAASPDPSPHNGPEASL